MKLKKQFLFFLTILSAFLCFSVSAFAADELLKPEELTSYNVENGIKLKWKKNKSAEKYVIYRKNSKKWEKLFSTEKAYYTDKEVSDGKLYKYKVRAIYQEGKSDYCYTSYRFLKAPQVISAVNSKNGITVTWEECDFATSYRLLRKKQGDKKWKAIKILSSEKTSYTDTKTENGVKYFYTLRQINGEYKSTYLTNAKAKTYTATVDNLSVKNSPDGITLRWKKGEDVKSYVIYRRVQSGKWKKLTSLKGSKTKYIDKTAVYGKKNTYKIRIISLKKISSDYCSSVSVYGVNPKKPMLALTYDDGPSSSATNSILDTMKKYSARATFFVVGSRVEMYSSCLIRQAELGCEIGCHTYNHTILTSASDSVIRNEISKTNALIEKISGQKVRLVRAPGGSANSRVLSAAGYPFIQWNVDTRDWEHRNSSKVISSVKNSASDGAIILMHDLYPSTASATKSFVPYLIEKGYQLVTVSEMFDAKGLSLAGGRMYYRA